jgi:hypothetical protein
MLKIFRVSFKVEADAGFTEGLVEDAVRQALNSVPAAPYLDYTNLDVELTDEEREAGDG